MPTTDSDGAAAVPRYAFAFSWDGPYGHVVRLLRRLNPNGGVVVDLGCGFGAVAEPLAELGYTYVGADADSEALKQLAKRGFETHQIDLRRMDDLPRAIKEMTGGQDLAALLLLDVIEHIAETRPFLCAVRCALNQMGSPPLVVSVPNVAHVDVGAKLAFGRWDYTPTGLLDATHLQFFTSSRLSEDMQASGLVEVAANDYALTLSDQHFPDCHPGLALHSPIAQALRYWRELADPYGTTVQFIRAFATCAIDSEPLAPDSDPPSDAPLMTIVMRTQGKRQHNLREALTCLAAQTVDDFDVLLMVHTDAPSEICPQVAALVDEFHETFSARVEIVAVTGGDRARPLNAALDRLRAEYVAFLDDDDLVTAHWVESFSNASDHVAIVRSVGCVRHIAAAGADERVPYNVVSSIEFPYSADFDPVHHLWGNETPICAFAVPRRLIQELKIRFNEELLVLEDWDFLMRCVALAPVVDTHEVTSIYQMWRSGQSSMSLHTASLWQATHRVLQAQINRRPIVLPAGTAQSLVAMCEKIDAATRELAAARTEADNYHGELDALRAQIRDAWHQYGVVVNSRRWRAVSPFAEAVSAWRRRLRPPR